VSSKDKIWFSAAELSLLGKFGVAKLPTSEPGCTGRAKSFAWEGRSVKSKGGKQGTRTEYRPPSDVLAEIQDFLQVNPDFFDSKKYSVAPHRVAHHVIREPPAGYAFKTGDEPGEDGAVYIDNYVEVRGSCGSGQYVDDETVVKMRVDADWLRKRVGNNFSHIKIASVHGDSMKPTLAPGDLVLVDTSCDRFIDDAIYAIQQDGHLRFKRIQLKLDGSIIVRSDNPVNKDPEHYTAEEAQYFKVVGMVIPLEPDRFKV
jgi:hypothetical protein